MSDGEKDVLTRMGNDVLPLGQLTPKLSCKGDQPVLCLESVYAASD